MAIADKFDYVRSQMSSAIEMSASHITWVIARETGKHIGSDAASIRAREDLQQAIEAFLRA
jgi:hypothetical protein